MNRNLLGVLILAIACCCVTAKCRNNFNKIGRYCVGVFGLTNSYDVAKNACKKAKAQLFDVTVWDDCELGSLKGGLEKLFPDVNYYWTRGVMNQYNAANTAKTIFNTRCGTRCNLPRFCKETCDNTATATNLYLKVKYGIACLANSPDNQFEDPVLCQYPY